MPDVTDNTDLRRFEMAVDGLIAYVTYALCGDRITLIHTQVPSELGGRGIGSALARSVLDNIRLRGLRGVAECEFIGGFIQKHQVYADLLVA